VTWLDSLTLSTVVVHTVAGPSFKGLRAAVHDDCIVLREVTVPDGDQVAVLAGNIAIPREQVSFLQIIDAEGGA
jgi:hypothetical protein